MSIASGLQVPLTPLQILWLNFVTGTLPAIALGIQPSTKDLMDQNKRPVPENFFTTETLIDLTYYGTTMGLVSLGNYLIAIKVLEYDLPTAQGATFANLTLLLLFHAYNCIDQGKTLFSKQMVKSIWLHISAVVAILCIAFAFISPIREDAFKHELPGIEGWAVAIGGTVLFMLMAEIYKIVKRSTRKLIKRSRTVHLSDLDMEF